VKFKGEPVTINGSFPQPGEHARDFKLTGKDLKDVSLKDFKGKMKILNIVPSLDTAVCSLSAKKFNTKVEGVKDTVLFTVAMDLPFAMGRACAESTNVVPLSAFRNREFMKMYGVEMATGPLAGLCARAVVVIDANDNVTYSQLVPEITTEPDYDAAINAVVPKVYKIGVLGTGNVGTTLAKGFIAHGHTAKIGSRDPSKVNANEGYGAGTFAEVAAWADVIVLAVKGHAALELVKSLATQIAGKPVLDATNPLEGKPPVHGVLSTFVPANESLLEHMQTAVPAAHFVKAFNSVGAHHMVHPQYPNGRRPTMFICGNDDGAKKIAQALVTQLGWNCMDWGQAETARALEPLATFWITRGLREGKWDHAFDILTK